jgi:hypothetical protein
VSVNLTKGANIAPALRASGPGGQGWTSGPAGIAI